MTDSKCVSTNKQIDWIITLRVIAVMAIILIHVVGGWSDDPYNGARLTGMRLIVDEVIIQILVRWAVPCFIMITGTLLLNPEKDVNLNKIYRYIVRMVIVLAVFGFGFCLIESIVESGYKFGGRTILRALKALIAGHSWSHMWYIYMMIGLYIMTPVLRSFVKAADKKEMSFLLIVLFLFTIAVPTVELYFQVEIYHFVPVSTYCIFYYLLGYDLSRRDIKTSIKWMLLLGGMLGFTVMLVLKICGANISASSDNLFVAIYSMGFFCLCVNNRFLERQAKNRIIQSLSRSSFGIYLLHPLFLNVLNKGLGVFPDVLPAIIGELLFWLVGFVGAYIATLVICRIRFFKEIIM